MQPKARVYVMQGQALVWSWVSGSDLGTSNKPQFSIFGEFTRIQYREL